MKLTIETVRKALGNKLIGNVFMRKQVCTALQFLPPDILENVCKSVWFISSPEDAWAFTFKGSDIKDKHLIFISDELLIQDEAQIRYTILHEVGHVVLSHRNSIRNTQTQTEIKHQEVEADNFVKKYYS